jgi:hypothetical protein
MIPSIFASTQAIPVFSSWIYLVTPPPQGDDKSAQQAKPRPLQSITSPIHYPSAILQFDAA